MNWLTIRRAAAAVNAAHGVRADPVCHFGVDPVHKLQPTISVGVSEMVALLVVRAGLNLQSHYTRCHMLSHVATCCHKLRIATRCHMLFVHVINACTFQVIDQLKNYYPKLT